MGSDEVGRARVLARLADLTDQVVLVDDDDAAREAVRFVLTDAGFAVSVAADGVEGLEVVRNVRPKVAVIDVMMPRMDGYQLCEAIRSDSRFQSVFVVFLSALAQPGDAEKALLRGADVYLAKPVAHSVLVDIVSNVMAGRLLAVSDPRRAARLLHYETPTGTGKA